MPARHRLKYQQDLENLEKSVMGGIELVLEQLDRALERGRHRVLEVKASWPDGTWSPRAVPASAGTGSPGR